MSRKILLGALAIVGGLTTIFLMGWADLVIAHFSRFPPKHIGGWTVQVSRKSMDTCVASRWDDGEEMELLIASKIGSSSVGLFLRGGPAQGEKLSTIIELKAGGIRSTRIPAKVTDNRYDLGRFGDKVFALFNTSRRLSFGVENKNFHFSMTGAPEATAAFRKCVEQRESPR